MQRAREAGVVDDSRRAPVARGPSWAWPFAMAGGSPVGAQKAPVGAGRGVRRLPEGGALVATRPRSGGTSLGPEGAAQWKVLHRLPDAAWRRPGPGDARPLRAAQAVEVDTVSARAWSLHLAATVDTQRTYTGTPGQPVAVTGRVEMKRGAPAAWTMVSETWQTSDGYQAVLVEAGRAGP